MLSNIKGYLTNTKNRKAILVVSVLLVFILPILFSLLAPGKSIDVAASDEDLAYYSTRARLYEGSELFKAIGEKQYDQLSMDVYLFGKNTYKAYRSGSKHVVGFLINRESLTKRDSKISFEGKYGSSSSSIKVAVELLKNERIKTSIKDVGLNNNIDQKLPSNSKTNKFIASLPFVSKSYSIYYYPDSPKLGIEISGVSDQSKKEAISFVASQTDDGFVNDDNIDLFYISASLSGDHTDYLQTYIKAQPSEDAED